MKNLLNHFHEAEIDIINAVAETELPIIVTGKKGSGKSTMGRLITSLNKDRNIFSGDADQLSYWVEIQKRNKVDLSKYVFVIMGEEGNVPATVGPHIKINTFNPATLEGFYFRVSPQLNKSQFNSVKLTPENPLQVVVSDDLDDANELYRPIVSINNSSKYLKLEREVYDISGLGGVKLINLNFSMILDMDDNYLDEGINIGSTSHNIKVFNLRATSEELESLDVGNVRRLFSQFDRHRTMMLITTDKAITDLEGISGNVYN